MTNPVAPNYLLTLEVSGRRSGQPIRLPMVMAVFADERYLGCGVSFRLVL
jgi:hypothetical protein